MTRTDRQQLVRDAGWRLSVAEMRERLTPEDIGVLGMAINSILGWGGTAAGVERDARRIHAAIVKMDGR